MTTYHILEHLAVAGISIAIEGDDKLVVSPASRLTDELRSMIREHKAGIIAALEAYEERAAIMEFDGLLDRKLAEQCAHGIVFCKDCVHHVPQPHITSRSGQPHATPSGCELGLIAPNSWPPIYSFTGWYCHNYAKTNSDSVRSVVQT